MNAIAKKEIIISTLDELPEYCYDCPCHDSENDRCNADKERRTSIYRPFWCPLKERKNSPSSPIYNRG